MFEPKPILGTDIVIYVRIVNVNPIPTTLHNFSLMVESEGKQWMAWYPKEPEPQAGGKFMWTPPEIIEQEKKMTNLITYLNNPDKMLTVGVGIDGRSNVTRAEDGWYRTASGSERDKDSTFVE